MCVFIFRVETTVCLLNWFGKKKLLGEKQQLRSLLFYHVFPNIGIPSHFNLIRGHTPAETRNLKIIMS